MAQPTKEANAAARAKLIGPFYNPDAAREAQIRANQLRDIIDELTTPAKLPDFLQPSRNPYNTQAATRTEIVRGTRIPSMYYNAESERKLSQALSAAKNEQEIVRAALAMFSSGEPLVVDPGITGPFKAAKAPAAPIGAKLGTLVDLLTHSPELNVGEEATLASKQGQAYSNRADYERLLAEILRNGSATFPK